MARTNPELVKGVLLADYDGASDLGAFIDTAAELVADVEVCIARQGSSLTETRLELLERWLAAHCYCCSDQPYLLRKTQSAMGKFQGETKQGLTGTKYGQMALNLEPSGCLAAAADGTQRKTAGGYWLGKPKREELTYDERN